MMTFFASALATSTFFAGLPFYLFFPLWILFLGIMTLKLVYMCGRDTLRWCGRMMQKMLPELKVEKKPFVYLTPKERFLIERERVKWM